MIKRITVTLHNFENQQIKVPVNEIVKLIAVEQHLNFPQVKTQIMLKPDGFFRAGMADNWLYVTESPGEINKLIDDAKNISE